MKSILEELFYGNVCPNTDCRRRKVSLAKSLEGSLTFEQSTETIG